MNSWSDLPFWDRVEAERNIFIQYPHMRVLEKKNPISTPAEIAFDFFFCGERVSCTIHRPGPDNGTPHACRNPAIGETIRVVRIRGGLLWALAPNSSLGPRMPREHRRRATEGDNDSEKEPVIFMRWHGRYGMCIRVAPNSRRRHGSSALCLDK